MLGITLRGFGERFHAPQLNFHLSIFRQFYGKLLAFCVICGIIRA
jgi:hypothetical protein